MSEAGLLREGSGRALRGVRDLQGGLHSLGDVTNGSPAWERQHPEGASRGGHGARSLGLWPNSVFNLFLPLLVPVCSTSLAPWVAPAGQRGALEGRGRVAYLFRPWQ